MKQYKVIDCYVTTTIDDGQKVESAIESFIKENPDYKIHSMQDVGKTLFILFEKDVREVTTLLND